MNCEIDDGFLVRIIVVLSLILLVAIGVGLYNAGRADERAKARLSQEEGKP